MTGQILPPRCDVVFKAVFGNQDTSYLTAFLQAVLDLPDDAYTHITLPDTHQPAHHPGGKQPILDVKAVLATGEHVDIEIQLLPQPGLRQRICYYTAKMAAEQLTAGQDYRELGRAITILITGHDLYQGEAGYHHRFRLAEPAPGLVFCDVLEVDTLELSKVPSQADGSALWKWLMFLNASDEQELAMAAELDPVIGRAATVVRLFSADEQARYEQDAIDKARWDEQAWADYVAETRRELEAAEHKLEAAERKAEQTERALEQTQHERDEARTKREAGIRRALARGLDTEVVADLFDATPEEIARLT